MLTRRLDPISDGVAVVWLIVWRGIGGHCVCSWV